MKSLTLTAQEARKLEKDGVLTIAKPIFNHIPPVNSGDVAYIREPWYQLHNPGSGEPSGRILLAADSIASEEQIAHKWESPDSMPEYAANRFVQVRSVTQISTENADIWEIELKLISKNAAEAIAAGFPVTPVDGEKPAATVPEEIPKDDEEIGSFKTGKCKYCNREWSVTLEGAKGGGYPTQRTADAAATRLCNCEEAVANRAPIVGVALAVTTGTCRYCGQVQEVGPHPSKADADETASEVCNCPAARSARREREQIEDAQERVHRLFGDEAEKLGFKSVNDGVVTLLDQVVELIAKGHVSSASINIRGQGKAKFSVTSKGEVKTSRSETRSCGLGPGA